MSPNIEARIRRLAVRALAALSLGFAGTAMAAVTTLFEQLPDTQNALGAMGSSPVSPLLAERFSFTGTGQRLSWWGTQAVGFNVNVYAGDGSGSALRTFNSATPEAAGFQLKNVDIDENGTLDDVDVYRFEVDLANLAGGSYTVSIEEVGGVDLGRLWYWLQGTGGDGDGESIVGFKDAADVNTFDLSLRVTGEPDTRVPEPTTLALVAAAALAGWPRRRARPVAA